MSGVLPSHDATSLVGRDRELATLRGQLDGALAGQGSLALIGGEAGIGKTALAEALCRAADARGALVLAGRCYDLTETPPYGPWLQVTAATSSADPTWPLGIALSLLSEGGAPDQTARFDRIAAALAEVAADQPILLLLEDMHWADGASLDLLRYLARTCHAVRLLMVITYRGDGLTRADPLYAALPSLLREGHPVRIDLGPLSNAALRALIATRYSLSQSDAGRLEAYLQLRAEGNPFFIGEILRSLEGSGALEGDDGGHFLHDPYRVGVPLLLRQVIDGRLDRLDEQTRGVIAAAAVIGHDIPLDLWAGVVGADRGRLAEATERAVAAHVFYESPDAMRVTFVHALVRQALYEGLPASRRRVLHARAGEMLAASPAPDPDDVAHHFQRASDEQAIEWCLRAGVRAHRLHALQAATERYQSVLALLGAAEEDGTGSAWACWSPHDRDRLRAVVRMQLALCTVHLRGLARGVEEMRAAVTLLDRSPLTSPGVAALLEALGVSANPRGLLVSWLVPLGYLDEARRLCEQILAEQHGSAPAKGEERMRGDVLFALSMAHAMQGRPDAARAMYRRSRAAYAAAERWSDVGYMALQELIWVALPYAADDVAGRCRLAAEVERLWEHARSFPPGRDAVVEYPQGFGHLPLLAVEGPWDAARELALAVRALNLEGGRRAIPTRILAPLAREQGDAELSWALVRQGLPAGPDTRPGETIFPTSIVLQRVAALLAIDAGDLVTARAWLAAHDRWLAWNGTVLGQAERHLCWAAYRRAGGDLAAAFVHGQKALAYACEPRQPLALLAAHRTLGEVETAAGRYETADAHLSDALALAHACAAPYERALTLLALAELHAAAGDGPRALRDLGDAKQIVTSLGATPALARASALASRIGAPSAIPAYPDGLTGREVQVLRLLSAGMSNREIAAALSISERTVNRHIANVYTKIDAHGRAEATAYALRHRLA